MHGSETQNTTPNLEVLLDTGGSQNFIHPSLLPKDAPTTKRKNTITQSYGEYETSLTTEINCKLLGTERKTKFIILNEEQNPIIIIGFPELKRRGIQFNCATCQTTAYKSNFL